jgi:hypothetical protein
MPSITFVKFNQYVGIMNKNKLRNYGRRVLLVASQILLGSLLLAIHLVFVLCITVNKHQKSIFFNTNTSGF